MNFENIIKKELSKFVKHVELEIPKDNKFGDYAFPCFALSKLTKKDPSSIANNLSSN